ncbi:MAG: NAD(P)-dependent oxidoreductase [Ignavibacteriae bacterium]|nr:NAD(P)-dependent oxidoreductase [Ignavibacteriota bacterium]
MRVLVTGGSGLVGRYVVNGLAEVYLVEVVDIKALHRSDIPLHRVDVLDLPALVPLIKGFDVVVHLAGIPHPLNDPPEQVFRVNTLGTFNVLEASARNGVQQVIFMSSESTLGFAFYAQRHWPEFLPVDETHPLRPQDAYGLSKVAGELLCEGVTRKTGMQTICLRAPWIWVPEEKAFYRQLVEDYTKWHKNLWAFVHVSDVVQAVRLAIQQTHQLSGHDSFFISADENWTGKESRVLAQEYYPETRKIADSFRGAQSFISTEKARNALGFTPLYRAEDIFNTTVEPILFKG